MVYFLPMIAHVEGTVTAVGERTVIVDVSGIGYTLYTTPFTQASCTPGKKIHLHTHLVVRQDSWDLYGFKTHDERALFLMLLNVPSIGPKTALAIVGVAPVPSLTEAIASG